ncbi:MAG: hypothetical protein KA773_23400, partial [Chloroflexi bacterium]|nr:hypothetical protein [Chloroflexota bacterium]
MKQSQKKLWQMGVSVGTAVLIFLALFAALNSNVLAAPTDSTYQAPPLSQDWSNTNLITTTDVWTGVPGIIGYRGDNLTTVTGTDPQTILADGTTTPINVIANQTTPNTLTSGGLGEFEITDPVVAFQGSG